MKTPVSVINLQLQDYEGEEIAFNIQPELGIIDEDTGINKKDIKRIFEPFFTGENGRKLGESTCMGLYISKEVCNRLGHNIEATSQINKETQVSITFKQ